jgi:hypothetical protein
LTMRLSSGQTSAKNEDVKGVHDLAEPKGGRVDQPTLAYNCVP